MLGEGVYIVSEVARLTKMHPNRVRSWFKERSDGHGRGPLFHSDYNIVEGDFAVSFLDLIDVLVAGQFRDCYGIPMRTIRRAYELLQADLNTKHPFCSRDLYTDGKRIFLSAANRLGDAKLSDVVSRQQFFPHVKEHLEHVDYSNKTDLANRWRIFQGVVIDPQICMGKPTIAQTGVTTVVASNQYYANSQNPDLVAELYNVRKVDILNAVEFEKWYRDRQAA